MDARARPARPDAARLNGRVPAPRPPLPGGPYLVVGLARSGIAVARALRGAGGEVRACDSGTVPAETIAALGATGVQARAADAGLDLLPGTHTVVKSPGVPQ